MRPVSVLGLVTLVTSVLGAPTVVPITKRAGPAKPNSYVVEFEHAEYKNKFVKNMLGFAQFGSIITHNYDVVPAVTILIGGSDELRMIQGIPGVLSIEPDSIFSIHYESGLDGFAVEGYQPPNDASGSQLRRRAGSAGEGVMVYGIDTGINVKHQEFEGRASEGVSVSNGVAKVGIADDDNGHGTHTAGTAVGKTFGQAPKANIKAVKVLDANGAGSTSDIVQGINWSMQDSKNNKGFVIFSMSLGGIGIPLFPSALSQACKSATDADIHVVVAAGNSDILAETSDPARVKEVITVAAVDKNNQKADFSNWGPIVDIFAPGVNITSAWIGSNTATNTISGTSMACPFVTGILACMISKYGPKSPADLAQALKDNAKHEGVTFGPLDPLAAFFTTHDLAQKW